MEPVGRVAAAIRSASFGMPASVRALGRDAGRRVDARLRPDLVEGWTGDDLPDQHGTTWAVTGGTHGIGLEAARTAAGRGARLVLFARNVERAEQLLDAWNADGRVIACDLSESTSVRAAASQLDERVDVLLNNAGMFTSHRRHTPEGHELMWATNFLGPFMLTNLIRPMLAGRIVVTGSEAHRWGRLDLADPDFHHRVFIGFLGYAQSKLADMVWAAELSRRLGTDAAPVVHVAHPGWAATNIQRHDHRQRAVSGDPGPRQRLADAVTRLTAQSAEAGSWPLLFAATQHLSGIAVIGPSTGLRGHPVAGSVRPAVRDGRLGGELWRYAARVTGTDLRI